MTSGNFNKLPANMLGAMKDSNYFERKGVEGVYEPRNTKAPVVTGSFKGDGKGFLDSFKSGAMGYFKDAQEDAKKSDTDKYLDFMRESRDMMQQGAQFGGMGGGMATEVAQGLNVYQPPSTQQMFIPGQEGKPGLFSLGGAIKGGIGGFMKGGPAGALGGAALGGFM
tara:strand:+ start:451 stop:951 length:501 start_codon:yes stop_codon:yes gene_type:complete